MTHPLPNKAALAKARAARRDAMRARFCFTRMEISEVASQVSFLPKEETDTTREASKKVNENILRLLLALQKSNPEKFFYLEQISDVINLDLIELENRFESIKEDLMRLYGLALRNRVSVGYRIADHKDLLIQTFKSISRAIGVDFKAMQRLNSCGLSRSTNPQKGRFYSELEALEENFLTELSQLADRYNAEHVELKFANKEDYDSFKNEIRQDELNATKGTTRFKDDEKNQGAPL